MPEVVLFLEFRVLCVSIPEVVFTDNKPANKITTVSFKGNYH